MMIATIEGAGKQRPREIKQSQWQRLWLAPDMAAYKNHLAAKVYEDILFPDFDMEETERIETIKERLDKIMETTKQDQTTHEESKAESRPEEKQEAEEKSKAEIKDEEKQEEKAEDKEKAKVGLTPMVRQFLDLKKKHPDALLLFRCGDFYETYMQDARKSAEILGITLTRSTKTKDPDGKPLEMAGFPYHALDCYLPKLIRAGQRVAICDQIEPRQQQEQKTGQNQPEQTETQTRGMRR